MTGRPLRIALLASNRYPIRQPFAGGLEAHVWHLARALGNAGHHVTLFAAPGSDETLGAAHLKVHTLSVSATARRDPSTAAEDFLGDHHAYLSLMLDLAGPLADTFDVVHNHSLHYLPVAMARALSVPMVCTLHTPPTPWLESALTATGHVPATFVSVSRHTAQAWRHALDAPATVIPNGVDLSGWPVGPGGTDLMWFGRIVPEKGAHLAIEVARRSGRRLLLAGPVSDRHYFDHLIAPHLGSEVVYLGHLPREELADRVGHSAAVLITPCWDEPYGLVVAEALACGTPVVAFARGGIPEIVDSGSGVLVPADDVEAMAVAVPEAVARSRGHARRRALEHCSERAMVESYVALYRRLVTPSAEPVSAGRSR